MGLVEDCVISWGRRFTGFCVTVMICGLFRTGIGIFDCFELVDLSKFIASLGWVNDGFGGFIGVCDSASPKVWPMGTGIFDGLVIDSRESVEHSSANQSALFQQNVATLKNIYGIGSNIGVL